MKMTWLMASGIAFVTLGVTIAFCEDTGSKTVDAASKAAQQNLVSVDVAREHAKLMQDIYLATLEVIHHHYFHGDRAVVPARALEDVFSVIKQKSNAQASWISVNMKAMSVGHKPESEFEKLAAKEIAKGKQVVELVADGYYQRAGAIPLTSNCVGCHGGIFKAQSKKPKFAGLVISIPIKQDIAENKSATKK